MRHIFDIIFRFVCVVIILLCLFIPCPNRKSKDHNQVIRSNRPCVFQNLYSVLYFSPKYKAHVKISFLLKYLQKSIFKRTERVNWTHLAYDGMFPLQKQLKSKLNITKTRCSTSSLKNHRNYSPYYNKQTL